MGVWVCCSVFVCSSVRYGRLWHAIAAAAVFIFVLFLGISVSGGVSSPSLWLGLTFGVPLALCVPLFLLARKHAKDYESSVRSGTWHEGVIVFPSGDVVVRFKNLIFDVDKTIEAAHLSRAEVERQFAIQRLWWRPHLRVHYVGIDARPVAVAVCDVDLRDPPKKIADYINAVKSGNSNNSKREGGGGVL